MKNFKFLTFAFLAVFAVSSVIFVNSCTKDLCKDVVCQNGGTCAEGVCGCLTGYEGTNCETETRTKIIAQYSVNENCTVSGPATYNVTIASISNVTQVTVTPFGGYPGCTGTLSLDKTALTLVSVSGAPTGITFSNFSGTVSSNGGTITSVSYTAAAAGPPATSETCTGTWTKL